MTRTKIMPGELFIVEYVDGAIVKRWAINDSKNYIELGEGRKAAKGFTDLLVEPDDAKLTLADSRYHVKSNAEAIKFVSDAGFEEFIFAEVKLQKLKLAKETQVYSKTGSLLGTLPAGTEIGTDTGTAGNSMPYLMVANCYKNAQGWQFLNQTNYSYGFVNVQQAFGLQQFDDKRTLVTAKTENVAQVDWASVALAIGTKEPETFLRGDLTAPTKDVVVTNVNDHFASIDLAKSELRDPIQYFANLKNKAFVEKYLGKINATKAADFKKQADAFNAK